jgi:hypothetical protein
METCEKCGAQYTAPDWPWCPHGKSSLVIQRDALPGGLIVGNLGPTPVKVYSHAERRAIMKARGLREAVYHVPGDKHVGRMV